MDHAPSKIAALVVSYYPDREKIQRLIELVLAQVSHVFIIDNGSSSGFPVWMKEYENTTYLPMNGNRGIGAALNVGLQQAVKIGCSHIITFDQDSSPASDMVGKLLTAKDQLIAEGHRVAAVGPSFVDHRQTPPMQYPFYRKSGWHVKRIYCTGEDGRIEVDALITSGCLYSVEAFKEIKPFDEGYFIDYIDTDWCFHARSLGFRLFGVCNATMSHELGSGGSISFGSIRLIEYSPLRRYYYFRNTIRFVRRPYVPWFWKLKLTFGLILRIVLLPVTPGARKLQQLIMMLRGVAHGLSERTGPLAEPIH